MFALILTTVVLAVVLIPTYFFLELSEQNEYIKRVKLLDSYSEELVVKMAIFESRFDDIFVFPRSAFFQSALFDSNHNLIFSTTDDIFFINDEISIERSEIYKKIELDKNIFGAKYLVIKSAYSKSGLYLRIFLLIFILLPLFFAGSILLLYLFLKPHDQARKLQELFFKDAMHEIKTPLGIISINLEMLSNKLVDNQQIKRARYAIKNLTIIYEDIEHLIRHKYIKYSVEKINLSQFLLERIDYFSEAIDIAKLTTITDIDSDIFVMISRVELLRIIDNNLSNAIKYSKENNSIKISLKKSDSSIKLCFADQGIGIKNPKDIFTRHYREDNTKGGFGIGLSIVKSICDKYNIKITVNSNLDSGSEFIYAFSNS